MAIILNKGLLGFILVALFALGSQRKTDFAWHPYHVSATEIEYNSKENRVEISSKLFTDDFEAVLTKLYKVHADFAGKNMKVQMDELVKRYITTHLAVRTNGKLLPLQFFGWEQESEAIIVYTTATATGFDPKNITVENTILYDQFNDQMNIVHFIIAKERKSSKLNYPDRKIQFSF